MNRHLCNVHGEEKRFKYLTCDNAFATNTDIKRHRKREEKKWDLACEVCREKFLYKDKLKDHMDSHTDNKCHVCPTCGCIFRYQSNLSRRLKGELIGYQSSCRLCVCLSVCLCVNIFKLEYLRNHWVNRNEILSEPSLGVGGRLH